MDHVSISETFYLWRRRLKAVDQLESHDNEHIVVAMERPWVGGESEFAYVHGG